MFVTIGETMAVANGAGHAPLAVHAGLRLTFAGAESNVAIGVARLGHAARMLTVLGDDGLGRMIYRALRGEGVDVSGVRFDAGRPTGLMLKDRHLPGEPEVSYYRSTSAMAAAGPGTFAPELWRGARVLYLTGITPALSASCLGLVREVLADVRGRGIAVWLDPNYRGKLWPEAAFAAALRELMPAVDVLLPGVAEAQILTGLADPREAAAALCAMGARTVVIKSGRRAMADGPGGWCEAHAPEIGPVVDPIGAGDAFAAGCASAYLGGLSPADWLARGHAVAGRVCLTEGDWEGLPTRAELAAFEARTGEARR